jgi:hypothetical protein
VDITPFVGYFSLAGIPGATVETMLLAQADALAAAAGCHSSG